MTMIFSLEKQGASDRWIPALFDIHEVGLVCVPHFLQWQCCKTRFGHECAYSEETTGAEHLAVIGVFVYSK